MMLMSCGDCLCCHQYARLLLTIGLTMGIGVMGGACGTPVADRPLPTLVPTSIAASPQTPKPDDSHSQQTLRVYHIGNSLTDTLNYPLFQKLVERRGSRYIYGRHMIPGAPLAWIWEHPTDGFKEDPYGYYPTALPNYTWDVLTLQPSDRHIEGADGDLAMAKNYINLTQRQSPHLRVYIYARWMHKHKDGSLEFDRRWLQPYDTKVPGSEQGREFFERLVRDLRQAYPNAQDRIFLIPVGDVMYELNQRMKAGIVPGYNTIAQLYKDSAHLNDVGSYLVAATFYATLYRDHPDGLEASIYGIEDPRLAAIIHQVVWNVVSTHPLAGVSQFSQ
ncbi:MAG: PEP-CTERM sorting domain-containing protein [Cyanobacteria bacterium]|nr:PEP-CTERM sorting domain-containing protein [Cyanobacteriota bacterium]MDW8202278.1 PEP-CTERM sorting domain-containing protein [Cyanobacteriota bacterium SKYGB_h_bin112]